MASQDVSVNTDWVNWGLDHRVYYKDRPSTIQSLRRCSRAMQCLVFVEGFPPLMPAEDKRYNVRFEIITEPCVQYLMINVFIPNSESSNHPGRAEAMFRLYHNGNEVDRKPEQYKGPTGYKPDGPISFSDEVTGLTVEDPPQDLVRQMTSLNQPNLMRYLLLRWTSRSYVWVEHGPQELLQQDSRIRNCLNRFKNLMDQSIKKGVFQIVVPDDASHYVLSRISFLNAIPPRMPSYWPWLQSISYNKDTKRIEIPISFGESFTISPDWVQEAHIKRENKDLIKEGIQAPVVSPQVLIEQSPRLWFVDEREYIARIVVPYLTEFHAQEDGKLRLCNKPEGDNPSRTCLLVPDLTFQTDRILILVRIVNDNAKEEFNDLIPHSGTGLPKPFEPVIVRGVLEPDHLSGCEEETLRGFVSQPPPGLLKYGCNIAVIVTRPFVPNDRKLTEMKQSHLQFTFGHRVRNIETPLKGLCDFMLNTPDDLKWFRDVLLGHDTDAKRCSLKDKSILNHDQEAVIKSVLAERKANGQDLNHEQVLAIESFYMRPLTILVGPPGTGKSTVIDIILQIEKKLQNKFLVLAESNKALQVMVSEFCEQLGLKQLHGFYRIKTKAQEEYDGQQAELILKHADKDMSKSKQWDDMFNPAESTENCLDLTKEAASILRKYCESQNLGLSLEFIEEEIVDLASLLLYFEGYQAEDSEVTMEEARSAFKSIWIKLLRKMVSHAAGIFATNAGVTTEIVTDYAPSSVIMDEASQSMEASAAMALVKALSSKSVARILIVGDDNQLPPCLISEKANCFAGQGRLSLLERLTKLNVHTVQLRTQYRMHPDISIIPNEIIYQGRIIDSDSTRYQPGIEKAEELVKGLWSQFGNEPVEQQLRFNTDTKLMVISMTDKSHRNGDFVNWPYGHQRKETSSSKYNVQSAMIATQIIDYMVRQIGIPARDILLIPFYRDQVYFHKAVFADIPELRELQIGTVDGSQGSEAKFSIVETVVIGDGTGMGILRAEKRRFNVGLTRGSCCTIVISNQYFTRNQDWAGNNHWTENNHWTLFFNRIRAQNAVFEDVNFHDNLCNLHPQLKAQFFEAWKYHGNMPALPFSHSQES